MSKMSELNPAGQKAGTVLRDFRIVIREVPHHMQRYDTCGDYFMDQDDEGDHLTITVSRLEDRNEMLLVAIHELIEWALCEAKGISLEAIDDFDMHLEGAQLDIESGDSPSAPYYHQHQIATGVERILAAEMGVDWLEYEQHIKELSQ